MPKVKGNFHYVLMMADTFTGWVEAFPCWIEKAPEVVKVLLQEIIPSFGLPSSIQSENGGAFIANVIQEVAEACAIKWNLHASWRP